MIEKLALWGMKAERERKDIVLPGSAERCVQRVAVEDRNGAVLMLEQLHPGQFDRRERIGGALVRLRDAGLPIPAYLAAEGRYVVEQENYHWQLSPYVFGDPLPQPDFVDHAERGVALGSFLVDLRRAGRDIREYDSQPRFDLEAYVNELMGTVAFRSPEIHTDLHPVLPLVAPLFSAWHDLPESLCHGDFHPLNMIWKDRGIAGVIDWEFMGMRPVLFDAANCLGCVGIEDPHALVKGLAPALLKTLRDGDCLDAASLSLLPEMVLAVRFAWMSEWLRKQDHEMISMELRYMRLLANSLDSLLPAWKSLLEM